MKIISTKSMNVVSECLDMFHVLSVADYIVKRKCKLLTGYRGLLIARTPCAICSVELQRRI